MIKILFFGTPTISVNALKALHESKYIEVIGVVTNNDQFFGRSRSKPKPSAVKEYAIKNNIHLIQSDEINSDINKIKEIQFDYLITCAFGQFLSDEILSTPKNKSLNIHASLLPRGRGGAPIHWSIIKGDKETGISFMDMVSEMDAGNYYQQYKFKITNEDTFDSLYKKLQKLIEKTTVNSIIEIDKGFKSTQQDDVYVTKWLNVKKHERIINFENESQKVYDQIRGLYSVPGATTFHKGKLIKVNSAEIVKNYKSTIPGEVIKITSSEIIVSTKNGAIALKNITLPSKKPSDVSQLVKGNLSIKKGDKFKNE